jgi:prolyl-tRNA editing enzyme YbaK/EbsC (Cys-tRNA(Pro) deacylase)
MDAEAVSPPNPSGRAAVLDAARAGGLTLSVIEYPDGTATAAQAAAAIGCDVAQIVKSLLFAVRLPAAGGAVTAGPGEPVLALVSGADQLDERRLAEAAGASGRAKRLDADTVRAHTGFAIGGVPPIGHRHPLRTFLDRDLLRHDVVWAAAGTPRAVFAIAPDDLVRISGAVVADLRRGL